MDIWHGGCTAISAEPNTHQGPLVDRETIRKVKAQHIRNQISPREMQAFEALGMADEIIYRSLLMEEDQDMPDDALMNVVWQDMDIELILDSGCCDHIMDVEALAPGYAIMESERSRRGGGFIVGNGEKLDDIGEAQLNLEANLVPTGGPIGFTSTFQAARVTRPLFSVSKICRNGFRCEFDSDQALIIEKATGETVCKFVERNGIYVTTVKLKSPAPFGRQAR